MFNIILIFLLLFFIIAYKTSLNVQNSLNDMITKENFESMNIKNECKDKEDIYNQKLSTPVAVNIPQPEYNNLFFIGENYHKDKPLENCINCFPIYDKKYDGVYNGNKINVPIEKQVINWNGEQKMINALPYNKNLIRVPEKKLLPNETIINMNDWSNQITPTSDNCQSDNPFSDIYIV